MRQKLFRIKSVPSGAKPYNIMYPCHEVVGPESKCGRALIILRQPSQADLETQCCPSGYDLDLLLNLLKHSGYKGSWMAMPFANWRAEKNDLAAKELWFQHVKSVAAVWKADRLLCLDLDPFMALVDSSVVTKGYLNNFAVGNVFKSRLKGIKVGLSLPLADMTGDTDFHGNGETNLLGFQLRTFKQILLQKHDFQIVMPKPITPQVVRTRNDFKKLLKDLYKNKEVAIDTETDGLQVRVVKMQTIQFATDPEKPWLLPWLHKDSPWTAADLEWMKPQLAEWFENSEAPCHIYMNSTFDLPVIKANIGYGYYKAPLWDVAMGEHCLDENMVSINDHYKYLLGTTKSVYALANIAATYWAWPYLTGLGKENRKHIVDLPLNDDVVNYAVTDVSLPLLIYRRQNERARVDGYKAFRSLMLTTESDKHHAFALMRWNGIPADLKYVQYLGEKRVSPIYRKIEEYQKKILASKAVQECNKRLARARGFSSDLFGGQAQTFRINNEKHKQTLFFDVLGLKPLRETKKGGGSLDKAFKKHYADIPEVAALNEIDAYDKLRTTYVDKVIDLHATDRDLQSDSRVRPRFSAFIVTGRIAESDPNMQQIPKKGRGLLIKRIYVAPPGFLCIKADYKAHEVRGWGIISEDPELATVFKLGIDLIDKYKENPTEEAAKKVYLYACPHRQNVQNVHGIDLAKTDPKKVEDLRDEIKGLTFGPIYGKGVVSMAQTLGKSEDYVREVLRKMFGRFSVGNRWLKDIEKQAMNHYYVEAPTGRRRNLMAVLLLPESSPNRNLIINAIKRKARNSPIQGMCSDVNLRSVRSTDTFLWKLLKKRKRRVGLVTANVVHDSQESFTRYEDFWLALKVKEYSMVTEAGRIWNRDSSSNLNVRFEIDMEVGSDYANMFKWDWSYDSIIKGICKALTYQRLELGYDFKPYKALETIMSRFDKDAPEWLIKQKNKTVDPKQELKKALQTHNCSEYSKLMGFDKFQVAYGGPLTAAQPPSTAKVNAKTVVAPAAKPAKVKSAKVKSTNAVKIEKAKKRRETTFSKKRSKSTTTGTGKKATR